MKGNLVSTLRILHNESYFEVSLVVILCTPKTQKCNVLIFCCFGVTDHGVECIESSSSRYGYTTEILVRAGESARGKSHCPDRIATTSFDRNSSSGNICDSLFRMNGG